MSTASVVTAGAIVGALDGVASSEDIEAGRSWKSTGVTLGTSPVVGWGWAPAVQVGAVIAGIAGVATNRDWGRGALCTGVGLFVRAGAIQLAQHRQKTPANAQGYKAQLVSRSSYRGFGANDKLSAVG